MQLQVPLSKLPGIGFTTARRLERLNLKTVEDLIHHYPFRYDDFSILAKAQETRVGEKVTLRGEVWSIQNVYTRSGKIITKAIFNDGTSPIELTWFNSSWLTKQIQTGDRLQVSGKISKYKNKLSIVAPQWEKMSSQLPTLHTGRLVPIYPETYEVSSKWLRTKIAKLLPAVLDNIQDPLPDKIRDNMLLLPEALQKIHFPENWEEAEKARERLSFDELFFIQLATQQTRIQWSKKTIIKPWQFSEQQINRFISSLPFKLTPAQIRVIKEIGDDLQKTYPMNRLLQGEVGSGKTVVATLACYLAHLNGFEALLMAPTEILAWQHFETVSKLLEPHGIVVGLYTGSKKFTKGNESSPSIIVGTHALLSHKLNPQKVGLVIIDEQHRFGVEQRSLLRQKGGVPHLLTLSATPIPRTVALTLYGDLDLSIIDELPKGRIKVSTHLVPEKKRSDAYKFIEKRIKEGGQAYIITPLIEQSETMESVKAAKVEFEALQKIYPHLKLGLLHGRMGSKEKEAVLEGFRKGKIQILISTSVVEVGMDIPNATIMVVEGAERFGLAGLHQLRGRVGRGDKKSYCLLFTSQQLPAENRRLRYLETTFDGLRLAELDLKIRGAGAIFGTAQHGRFELKIGSLQNQPLIEKTKKSAQNLLARDPDLDKHPALKAKLSQLASNVMPD